MKNEMYNWDFGGAFHLAKIFRLKLGNFSLSEGKAFSMWVKNLQSHW